ncbi:MAG: alpha/beta hydrolase [Acidimicrobiales bacterium]
MELDIASGGFTLRAYAAAVADDAALAQRLLILCHGFPSGPKGAALSGHSFPQLAQRLATEAGWSVLSFNFRGTGESGGDFSLRGWLEDISAVLHHASMAGWGSAGIWLAGFDIGGSLALCATGADGLVKGVACLAGPAEFSHWAGDGDFLERARQLGVVHTRGFPPDPGGWADELVAIRPVDAAAKISPRPVLIVHGSEDEVVPVTDARLLADSAGEGAELRVLTGAGHRLRHDPRAVAVLLGWLERHSLN